MRQNKEVRAHKLREMYARVLAWYSEIETTYGFHYGSAAILQYASSSLQFISTGTHQEFMLWSRLRTETVAQIIEHLVYEARASRLYWIPYPVRQDARTLELHSLPFTDTPYSMDICKKVQKLLTTIDPISWKDFPSGNKIPRFPVTGVISHCGSTKPTKIRVITPVFENVERVLFDAEMRECHLPEMYWIQPDASGKIDGSGGPTGEPDSTVQDEILEDLDDEMVDEGTAGYLQRSFGKAVTIADGSGPSNSAIGTARVGPQLHSVQAPVPTEGAPSAIASASADIENVARHEHEGSDNNAGARERLEHYRYRYLCDNIECSKQQ